MIGHPRHYKNQEPVRRFSKIHSIIDVILLIYFWYLSQWIIVGLVSFIICFNIVYSHSNYLYWSLTTFRKFKIDLFHATAEMLPISLSIAYYDTNDRFIDTMFAAIFISFIYNVYNESNKMTRGCENNVKMLKIITLCIILDYIQVIILILSKLYMKNSFYFYKFIITAYPVPVGSILTWIYIEINRSGLCMAVLDKSRYQYWTGFWLFILFMTGAAMILECANASWIIWIYSVFMSKFRNAGSSRFDEKIRDELVQWLQKDKSDLLIKVCCINHIKLKRTRTSLQHLNQLEYLQNNVNCHKSYYKQVWYIVSLWKTITGYTCYNEGHMA